MGRVRVASARAFGSPPDGIAEMLNAPHALDVASLSAALKIDLAVALGIIRDDDASIFRKINSIRNTFAHSSRTEFGETDARDFCNAWPPSLGTSGRFRILEVWWAEPSRTGPRRRLDHSLNRRSARTRPTVTGPAPYVEAIAVAFWRKRDKNSR
jgi:hypothetical protein